MTRGRSRRATARPAQGGERERESGVELCPRWARASSALRLGMQERIPGEGRAVASGVEVMKMLKTIVALCLVVGLSACGGGGSPAGRHHRRNPRYRHRVPR